MLLAQVVADPAALDNPLAFAKLIFTGVTTGNWFMAAAALLVLVVGLLRLYGKKLHDALPDNLIWDVPLAFLFDTRPGGWVLGLLTALGGGAASALLAGQPVTWALLKPIFGVWLSGAALLELGKDVLTWWRERKALSVVPTGVNP